MSSAASTATAEIFTFSNNPVNGSSLASTISPSVYSNLASPFPLTSPAFLPMTPFSPPPSVNRTLKPKQQGTGGADGSAPPPSVNRQLKPNREFNFFSFLRWFPLSFLFCFVRPRSYDEPTLMTRYRVGPVSGVGQPADFHGSSSDDADDPSSRGSSRPNSAHDEEQVN